MTSGPVSPNTTLAIVLGFSEFPFTDLDPLEQAAKAANDFIKYLGSQEGLNLPQKNILCLINSRKPPSEIAIEIADFLKNRQEALKHDNMVARDLIFYYVGHGGFTGGDQAYFLALRSTKKGLEGPTSLRMVDLSETLINSARNLRRFLILDCCFAATAGEFFEQSSSLEAMRKKTLDSFPRKGTALLGSSSASNVSRAPKNEQYTMFSGALLEVLQKGNPDREAMLSFDDIGTEIQERIKMKFEGQAVRPKVSSPDEREGDIADIPLFPNRGYRLRVPVQQPEEVLKDRTQAEADLLNFALPYKSEPRIYTFLLLHKIIGIIGLALPLVLALGKIVLEGPGLEPSISSYYYTSMRSIFEIGICAIGILLLLARVNKYEGDGRAGMEIVAGSLACISAIGMVIFPTNSPGVISVISSVHELCTLLFFLLLAYFCINRFTITATEVPTRQKLYRTKVYRLSGYMILGCILGMLISGVPAIKFLTKSFPLVFWFESIIIIAFGWASLTKGTPILKDEVFKSARAGKL